MTIKKITRAVSIAVLFLIPLFPLIVANSFFFPFITGKAFYFRILIEIGFASWVILAFLDARYRPRFTPLTIGVTLFAAIALFADLLGVNALRSLWSNFERMEGWLVIAHLWAFYMVSAHVFGTGEEGKRWWHRWLTVSVAVASIVAVYGILQLAGVVATHQGSRVDASLGNAAYMAVYMLMHAGIAAYLTMVARARQIGNAAFLRWSYPIMAVLFGFIVVATATRGTTLGLVGGIMLACVLYATFGKNASRRSRFISGAVIIVIVVLGVLLWTNRSASFVQKNDVLNRLASISWSNTQGQARQYIWPMAVKGALERPILGWGQENFNYIFNKDYDPKLWGQEQWFDRAHSVFLDWFVASGFVGLTAYLALYVLLLAAIWRSNLAIGERTVLIGLVAGYAIHNIFVFDNLASYVLFFALLGFGGSLRSRSSTATAMPLTSLPRTAQRINTAAVSSEAVEYIVAPITIVALVAGMYFLNLRPIQANTRLITAMTVCTGGQNLPDASLFARALIIDSYLANQEIREQLLLCAGNVVRSQLPNQVKQSFFVLAMQAYEAQLAVTPDDARIYVLGASFLTAAGQRVEAQKALVKAHELTPNKQTVTIQLADIYLNYGEYATSTALLKQAYESDPNYPQARSAYLIGLIASGNDALAQTLFGATPEIFETNMVARAYAAAKSYPKSIATYKKLLANDVKNADLRAQLAQTYYAAGMTWQAIETMRAIAADFPEYKAQVDEAIKEIQSPNK